MSTKARSKLTSLGKKTIRLEGKTVSYNLKRSPKSKSVRFQVRPDSGLTVVIPRTFKPDGLPDILRKHSRWILDKLARCLVGQRQSKTEPGPGDTIPYLGRALPLLVQHSGDKVTSLRLEGKKLVVRLGAGESRLSLVLEQWYRMEAGRVIRLKLDELCVRFGLAYNRLFIRGQRTRWGSCSKKGNLGFNWKLILTPEPVVEYVVIHELAHLREMNHGKKFWALVGKYCPDWRQHRKWLTEHGNMANNPFMGQL